jgi:hypothetical protein
LENTNRREKFKRGDGWGRRSNHKRSTFPSQGKGEIQNLKPCGNKCGRKKKEEEDADERTIAGKIQETLGRCLEDAPLL